MANPTFEESLQELEEALDAFQKGMVLSKQCKDTLSKAEKSLTKMMTESNEEVPFEEENQ